MSVLIRPIIIAIIAVPSAAGLFLVAVAFLAAQWPVVAGAVEPVGALAPRGGAGFPTRAWLATPAKEVEL